MDETFHVPVYLNLKHETQDGAWERVAQAILECEAILKCHGIGIESVGEPEAED